MSSPEVLQRRLARANARVAALEAVVEDRTRELFLSNEELTASNAFMTDVLRSMAGGLIVVDQTRSITLVNRRLIAMVRWPEDRVVGSPIHTVLPAAGTYRREATGAQEEETELVTADGTIPILLTHGAIQSDQGHIYVVIDARERKAAEAALESAQAKLVDASRRAGMAEIATGVIHNVGNVITAVNVSLRRLRDAGRDSRLPSLRKVASLLATTEDLPGLFQSAKGAKLPPFVTALTEQLEAEAARRETELDSVLEHLNHVVQVIASQQKHAKPTLVVQEFPATAIVTSCLDLYRSRIETLGIEVTVSPDAKMTLRSDRHQLVQILVNLVDNALDAMTDVDGRRCLHVSATQRGLDAVFEVRDSGVGVPAENLARIFEHGFTTRQGGHGFGLHMSANAAVQLGGRLECRSDGPGRGSTFALTVPLQVEPVEAA